jgi:2,5-diamino-6-(ribosylamino)-4(3H)-pyrimidinone 5'-phosphate reductase
MNPLPRLHPKPGRDRPFVFMNVAITADGKLAPANRHFIPFGSRRDHDLLLTLRARSDAVMAGARTVDSPAINMGPGPKKYRDLRIQSGLSAYNLRVVISGTASISPDAGIFKHRFSPILILVTGRAPKSRRRLLEERGAVVKVCGEKAIDFAFALRWLRKEWNVKRLLCEGGGEINAALLEANLVDEIYVTVCPLVFGGRAAPTLADGLGIERLADATGLKIKAAERIGNELYLVYTVRPRS